MAAMNSERHGLDGSYEGLTQQHKARKSVHIQSSSQEDLQKNVKKSVKTDGF